MQHVSQPAQQELTETMTRIIRKNSLKKNPELTQNDDSLNINVENSK